MNTETAFDWKIAKEEAEALSDAELVARAKEVANAFTVLWREAESRQYGSGLCFAVSTLRDRPGLMVEGYRKSPV